MSEFTIKDPRAVLRAKVIKFGNGARIPIKKEYLGEEVFVIIGGKNGNNKN